MNAHQLNDAGLILNTIVVDSLDVFPNLIDASIGGSRGDSVINGALIFAPSSPPTVPQSVPMLNAKLALIGADLIGAVEAYFASMEGADGLRARTFWLHAQNVRRDNEWVESARVALGITAEQIDQLFIAADGIA